MATLVFADTHLSDRFEPNLFAALKPLIERADTVIILGDLWDWYKCSFDAFYTSQWQQLFPLLMAKQSYYFFGNHDRHSFMDERVETMARWCGESLNIELEGVQLHIEHGDQVAPSKDHYFPRLSHWTRPIYMHYYPLEDAAGKRATWLRGILSMTRWWAHLRMARFVAANPSTATRLFGHSHIAVADPVHTFYNPGAFGKGWAKYLWIEGGKISLVQEPYVE